MNEGNQIDRTYNDFNDFEDFAKKIVQHKYIFTHEAKDLFLKMAKTAHMVYFNENIHHPDLEYMEDNKGDFRWHLLKNKSQAFVMCIWHKVFQVGKKEPINAFFNLRIQSNINNSAFSQHSKRNIKIVAEDNLNKDVDGDFSFFFDCDNVLDPVDILPLFSIWIRLPRDNKSIDEIRKNFQDQVGMFDYHKNYKLHFTRLLLPIYKAPKPPKRITRSTSKPPPLISMMSPEIMKMIHKIGPSDLQSQSVYKFKP
jgi:hypothetical protein